MRSLYAMDFQINTVLTETPDWLDRPWITLTCSRLGHDHKLHREVCRYIARSMLDCRIRNAIAVIATGSAVETWAERAAKLHGVDSFKVSVATDTNKPPISFEPPNDKVGADELSIAIGDRVDAVYVRSGGRIYKALEKRIKDFQDASVRVACNNHKPTATQSLVSAGAIGWHINTAAESHSHNDDSEELKENSRHANPDWAQTDGRWLVHCTRACQGPWPGQTQNQYHDELLLGGDIQPKTPFATLERILRSGKLIGNAIVTNKNWPVVCFSEAPLMELLQRRCFRPHLKRWDYEPFGIAIRKSAAESKRIQPVIYGQPGMQKQLPHEQRCLFQATGKTYDWRQEREWRAVGDIDLNSFAKEDVRVFVPSIQDAKRLQKYGHAIDTVSTKS